jgi:hypothetical protein
MRSVELVCHTDNDGDKLSPEGIAAAEAIGRERLTPPYDVFGSTGARRATEMVEILRRIVGQDDCRSPSFAGALHGVFDALPDGGRALVVAHSPTNEAAVLGLAGMVVGPLGTGEGVLVVEDIGRFEVRPMGTT